MERTFKTIIKIIYLYPKDMGVQVLWLPFLFLGNWKAYALWNIHEARRKGRLADSTSSYGQPEYVLRHLSGCFASATLL